jgi:hypothetical protein
MRYDPSDLDLNTSLLKLVYLLRDAMEQICSLFALEYRCQPYRRLIVREYADLLAFVVWEIYIQGH